MDIITQHPNFFQNPLKIPLNELYINFCEVEKENWNRNKSSSVDQLRNISNNLKFLETKIPALNSIWIQRSHCFYEYQPYFLEVSTDQNNNFLAHNKLLLENINFLLHCTYHQFWCYVVWEPAVRKLLNSFLLNALPYFELEDMEPECRKMYTTIYEQIAKILCRIVTRKESQIEFMEDEKLCQLIFDDGIISFASILQICTLYSDTNPKLVQRIIFLMAKFHNVEIEIEKMIDLFELTLQIVENKVCPGRGKSTSSLLSPRPALFDPYWYLEIVSLLSTASNTLATFLRVCPLAMETVINSNLPHRLFNFYNCVYIEIYDAIEMKRDLPDESVRLEKLIRENMTHGRYHFLNIIDHCLQHHIANIDNARSNAIEQEEHFEKYYRLVSKSMEFEHFLFDYQNCFYIDQQISQIRDIFPALDQTRSSFLTNSLKILPQVNNVIDAEERRKIVEVEYIHPQVNHEPENLNIQEFGTNLENIDGLIENISNALEELSLGDGFIYECLKFYNYDPHEVISAILDENLPPSIAEMPRDMIIVPPEPEPVEPLIAYRGKKPSYIDATHMLDDKNAIKEVKDFVLKSSLVAYEYDVYNDEHDDRDDEDITYLQERNHGNDDNPYKYMDNRFEGSESTDSDNDLIPSTSNQSQRRVGDFCENPEIARARFQQTYGKSRSTDVQGKPKGQGQDKDVQQNRDRKNTQKSSRANHNRKSGAAWKRSKGML